MLRPLTLAGLLAILRLTTLTLPGLARIRLPLLRLPSALLSGLLAFLVLRRFLLVLARLILFIARLAFTRLVPCRLLFSFARPAARTPGCRDRPDRNRSPRSPGRRRR